MLRHTRWDGLRRRRPAPARMHPPTAVGDAAHVVAGLADAARIAGYEHSSLELFGMPNVPDIEAHLLAQDVIWVMGGSVANLLAWWRLHGLDAALHRA